MLDFIVENKNIFIEGGLAILVAGIFYIFIRKIINPLFYFTTILIYITIELISLYFQLYFITLFATVILMVFILIVTLASQNVLKKFGTYVSNNDFFVKQRKDHKESSRLPVDELRDTVLLLSETKTGAIITIERSVNMDSYIQEGVQLYCPLKKELLTTIFYSGTPLHDGAVVIRNNIICAASVYYQPATAALTGRYGARHRAALGISQVTDSLTIVVSEETGRISFVEKGELETVTRDRFPSILVEKLNRF